MKSNRKTLLSTTIAALIGMGICANLPVANASDTQIYTTGTSTTGDVSILLMIDTSGSMGISSLVLPRNNKDGSPGDVDESLCELKAFPQTENRLISEYVYNVTENKTLKVGNGNVTYQMRGCQKNGEKKYDRISRLKQAFIELLARDPKNGGLPDNIRIGLGHFPSIAETYKPSWVGAEMAQKIIRVSASENTLVDGHSGRILVPVASLTADQRYHLAQTLADIKSLDGNDSPLSNLISGKTFKPAGGTPAANAYAEAGAYMMGTGTGDATSVYNNLTERNGYKSIRYVYDGFGIFQRVDESSKQIYFICDKLGNQITSGLNATYNIKQCQGNYWPKLVVEKEEKNLETKKAWRCKHGVYSWDSAFYDAWGNRHLGDVRDCKPGGGNTSYSAVIKVAVKNTVTGIKVYNNDGSENKTITGLNYDINTDAGKKAARDKMWQIYDNVKEGEFFAGGWRRVKNMPLDIEPITAKAWSATDDDIGFNVMYAYRANPFALVEKEFPIPDPATNGNYNNEVTIISDNGRQIALKNPEDMKSYTDNNHGGMLYSNPNTLASTSKYKAGGTTNQCGGNGIYFLTDGAPNSTKDSMAQAIMNESLKGNNGKYQFGQKPTGGLVSPTISAGLFSGETGGWEYIGAYAQKLADKEENPAKMKIRTAVVGFGSSFETAKSGVCDGVTNADAKNACLWGQQYGQGGFYYAENTDDITNSLTNFVSVVQADAYKGASATGAPSTTTNSFNPLEPDDYAYYGSLVSSKYKLWLGNLNKFDIDATTGGLSVDNNRLLMDNGKLVDMPVALWGDGFVSKIPVGSLESNAEKAARKVFTDNGSSLEQVTFDKVKDKTISQSGYWARILGYDVELSHVVNAMTQVDDWQYSGELNKAPTLNVAQQSGAVMHSTPLKVVRSGNKNATQQYVVFGTTDGILHVVNDTGANDGKELMAFVPDEFMRNNQRTAFMGADSAQSLPIQDGNGANIAGEVQDQLYGVDGAWSVSSKYVYLKPDSTKPIGPTNQAKFSLGKDVTIPKDGWAYENGQLRQVTALGGEKTSQTIYGGLRMGGRSYYALDITDIDSPQLKFKIDPESGKVYSSALTDGVKEYAALKYMGQSWSKPTLGKVKINGQTHNVMIVGGGYDNRYEGGVFDASTKAESGDLNDVLDANHIARGAGVYMFDTDSGELLWWTSGHSVMAKDSNQNDVLSTGGAMVYTKANDMYYSVVSQINAVDRDGDGYIDNLYFGDLGGQGWRVDINNNPTGADNKPITENDTRGYFARVVRLLNRNTKDVNNATPRFYEMPNLSLQQQDGQRFISAVFVSGDRTKPLSGKEGTGLNAKGGKSARDGIFVVHDTDILSTDLFKRHKIKNGTSYAELQSSTVYDGTNSGTGYEPSATGTSDDKLVLNVVDVPYNSENQLKSTNFSTGITDISKHGWFYYLDSADDNNTNKDSDGYDANFAGKYKALNATFSIDNYLFVNVFERDVDKNVASSSTTNNACSTAGKLAGSTSVYMLCLPTGTCDEYKPDPKNNKPEATKPSKFGIGAGIASATIGARGRDGSNNSKVGLVAGGKTDNTVLFTIKPQYQIMRWYESRKDS